MVCEDSRDSSYGSNYSSVRNDKTDFYRRYRFYQRYSICPRPARWQEHPLIRLKIKSVFAIEYE